MIPRFRSSLELIDQFLSGSGSLKAYVYRVIVSPTHHAFLDWDNPPERFQALPEFQRGSEVELMLVVGPPFPRTRVVTANP